MDQLILRTDARAGLGEPCPNPALNPDAFVADASALIIEMGGIVGLVGAVTFDPTPVLCHPVIDPGR